MMVDNFFWEMKAIENAVKKEKVIHLLQSAAAGVLLGRAIPLAAVTAGWQLSMSVGVTAGELLSALIFILGSGSVVVSGSIQSRKLNFTVKAAAMGIYAYAAGSVLGRDALWSGTPAAVTLCGLLDCSAVGAAVMQPVKWRTLASCAAASAAVWCAAFMMPAAQQPAAAVTPLAASLLAGCAAAQLQKSEETVWTAVLAGMTAVLLLNTLY